MHGTGTEAFYIYIDTHVAGDAGDAFTFLDF